jgi:hypothetical protein
MMGIKDALNPNDAKVGEVLDPARLVAVQGNRAISMRSKLCSKMQVSGSVRSG